MTLPTQPAPTPTPPPAPVVDLEPTSHPEQPEVPAVDELAAKALARSQEVSRSLSDRLFTADRIALIKKQICPAGISDADFALFLEQCRRSGLDPLMKEAWCVPRTVKVKRKNEKGVTIVEEVEVHVFQAAEHGMQIRAHRSGVFLGMRAGAIYENDSCELDFATGKASHKVTAGKPRGVLIGAWAIAYRSDLSVSPIAHVLLSEYRGESPLWKYKPETMIVKVARAHALRLSFPYEFAGAYIPEELEAAEEPTGVDSWLRRVAQDSSAPLESRAEQVRAKLAANASPAQKATPPSSPEIPLEAMRFGKGKGKRLTDCSGAELEEGLQLAEKALADNPKAAWAPAVAARISMMHGEQARRAQALETKLTEEPNPQDVEPARQPGQEG